MANPSSTDAAQARRQALAGCLVLTGPTASGKTAAALAVAARWPVEIISMDSALVYTGMDIGSAKPSAAERAVAPHHLLDVRDPLQAYSAADFIHDTLALMPQILARGCRPLLVGGTLLYLRALLDGLDALPGANPAVRAALDAQAAVQGWPALHAELAQVDPATAQRLAPQDAQRIQRALEVYRCTGRPLSSFHTIKTIAKEDRPAWTLPIISLEPSDRAWLHARIARRFDAMLAEGLLDEVQALRARGDLHTGLPSMRCVGYRQAWEALDSGEPLAAWRERGIAATRQLAKRQLTWLRSMPGRHIVPCDSPQALDRVLAEVARHWGPGGAPCA